MGFFSNKQLMQMSPDACGKCNLGQKCKTPKIKPFGKGKKGILVVVDSPTKNDDLQGFLLSGDSGDLLHNTLADVGIDLNEDCRVVAAVGCHIDGAVKINHVQTCLPALMKELYAFKPKIIVTLGNAGLQAFYGKEFDSMDMESKQRIEGLDRVRGFALPNHEHKCWIVPLWSPRFVLGQSQGNGAAVVLWKKDMKMILEYLDKPLPQFKAPADCIQLLEPLEAARFLNRIMERKPLISFDYEASGLKLHRKGHFIQCVGVAVDEDVARAFVLDNYTSALWKEILQDRDIHKVAHNMRYEDSASRNVLGVVRTRGWTGDTCLIAHLISCRPVFTALKFQTRLWFGVADWGVELEKYLESTGERGDNNFNTVDKAPKHRLLFYCASDALWTLRLFLLWQRLGYMVRLQLKPN